MNNLNKSKIAEGKQMQPQEPASPSIKNKLNLRYPKYSNRKMLGFAVLFGVIAAVMLWRAFASAPVPVVGSVEAENMLPQLSNTSTSSSPTLPTFDNATCKTSSAVWQSEAISNQTGSFSAAYYVIPNASNVDAVGGFSARPASSYNDLAAIVRFNNNGKVDARNGGNYSAINTLNYSANSKYLVRMVVNITSHSYDAYVTPVGSSEVQIAKAYAFRSEQSSVTNLAYFSTYTSIGSHQFCSLWMLASSGVVNLALNRPAKSSSNENNSLSASSAFDGMDKTRWSSAFSDPQWLQVDLGSVQNFNRVVLKWETAYAKAYQLQVSNDGQNWSTIYSTTTSSGGINDLSVSGSGRYVRMYGTQRGTQWGYSLWKMEIYGQPVSSSTVSAVPQQIEIGTVLSDSTASNGKDYLLWSNGTISSQFINSDQATYLSVTAKSSSCNNTWGHMVVKIDGAEIINNYVASATWNNYSSSLNLPAGSHQLSITFDNDYYASGVCDRNLYVDVTTFYGGTTTPPTPTVTLSATPLSITAGGNSTLTWSSTNAGSCLASGAWSGAQPTTGSFNTGALNQTSTYNLTCTGAGGSAKATVTVTVVSGSTRNADPSNILSVISQSIAGDTVFLQDGSYSKLVLNKSFSTGRLTLKCSSGAIIAGVDTNGQSGYTFDSCKVVIAPNSTDISSRAVENRGPSANITWIRCSIKGGFISWDVYGASGSYARNISIIDSDISGGGGDLIHTNGVDGLLIEHNNIHDPYHDTSLANPEHHDGWQPQNTYNAQFIRNHVYWTSGAGAYAGYTSKYLGQGIMISGNAGAVRNVLIANNLIDHYNGRPINMQGVSGIRIVNNTFEDSGDGIGITIGTNVSGLEIWNNILMNVYNEGGAGYLFFDNNWYTGGNGGYLGNSFGTNYYTGNPGFLNTSTYALSSSSPAYSKGVYRANTPSVDIDNTQRPNPPALGARL